MYAWAFGCNLDELEQPDLKQYASLGDFFYRKLKPGVRPIADVPLVRGLAVACPCAGRKGGRTRRAWG